MIIVIIIIIIIIIIVIMIIIYYIVIMIIIYYINKLLREGRIIQSRIGKLRSTDPPDKSKVFTKLVLEGQINSALRFLSESTSGGVLSLTDEVMTQLQLKHPNPQPAKSGSLLFGPFDDEFPESVYSGINGELVRQAALRTKGSGVPVALTRTASDEC